MPDYCPEQLPAGLPREPDASAESIDHLGMASRKAATVPLEAGGHDTCIEAIPAPSPNAADAARTPPAADRTPSAAARPGVLQWRVHSTPATL